MLPWKPASWELAACLISPESWVSIPRRFARVKQTSRTYRTFLLRMSGKKGRPKGENRGGSGNREPVSCGARRPHRGEPDGRGGDLDRSDGGRCRRASR